MTENNEHWSTDEKQRALFWSVVEGLDWSAIGAKGPDSDKVHQFLGVEDLRHFPGGIAEALGMVKDGLDKQAKTIPPPAAAELADLQLAEYGTRDNIAALARRMRSMMPGGDKLTLPQAMAAAQYAILVDANPFRGEIYAYPDKRGKLVLVDGYKLLVRWAKRQAQYSERYERMGNLCAPTTSALPAESSATMHVPDGTMPPDGQFLLPASDVGFTCWILRNDALPLLKVLIEGGADYKEAFEIAATSAVGIIRRAEMWSARYNKAIDPPKGWTWEQVARKRALKNTLNLSHGAPSPREIAREGWIVGETKTIPADWEECTPEMPSEARARLAALTADYRTRKPDNREPEQVLVDGRAILHGDGEGVVI